MIFCSKFQHVFKLCVYPDELNCPVNVKYFEMLGVLNPNFRPFSFELKKLGF